MIEFPDTETIHTIFLAIPGESNNVQKRFGTTHVRIGSDGSLYNTNDAKVKEDMTSGGFFELNGIPSGKYLTIRRGQIKGSKTEYNF